MLVATTPTAVRAASELTAGTRKWRTSTHAPRSLLGVQLLLDPLKAGCFAGRFRYRITLQ